MSPRLFVFSKAGYSHGRCRISFLAPGLWNATNSLGAGGALEPYLVKYVLLLLRLCRDPDYPSQCREFVRNNLSRSMNIVLFSDSIVFGLMGLFCVTSALMVNIIGVKRTLILGTLGWPLYSASLCAFPSVYYSQRLLNVVMQIKIIDMAQNGSCSSQPCFVESQQGCTGQQKYTPLHSF